MGRAHLGCLGALGGRGRGHTLALSPGGYPHEVAAYRLPNSVVFLVRQPRVSHGCRHVVRFFIQQLRCTLQRLQVELLQRKGEGRRCSVLALRAAHAVGQGSGTCSTQNLAANAPKHAAYTCARPYSCPCSLVSCPPALMYMHKHAHTRMSKPEVAWQPQSHPWLTCQMCTVDKNTTICCVSKNLEPR